jgi:hypothetical protein
MRSSYIEVVILFHLRNEKRQGKTSHQSVTINPKLVTRFTCFQSTCDVGNITQLSLPAYLDPTEPQGLIIMKDGSVLFDVGYHSCLVSTKYEEIFVSGGGPDDGAPQHMPSYR